jgi:formylmethanofuran dehydrogenase subunit E
MLKEILDNSASRHKHLCPRQVLGARIGLAGMKSLGFFEPPKKKQLLIISETDGCFVDGIMAATGCTVGYRTLRIEDYGKVAATFVDVKSGRSVRVAPQLDVRERAAVFVPNEPRRYFAQLQAYQIMPDEVMFTLTDVALVIPVEELVSRPGMRCHCVVCGEEIMNEREIFREGLTLCRPCADGGYYQLTIHSMLSIPLDSA